MSRARITARLTSMEVTWHPAFPRDLLTRMAAACDLTADELIAETHHLLRRCHAAGAITRDAQVRFVADACGIPVAELERELATLLEDLP